MGRPLVITVLEDVGQGELQEVLIKLDGPLHVGTEEGHMVHPAGCRRGTRGTGMEIRRAQPGAGGGKGGEIAFGHRGLLSETRGTPAPWTTWPHIPICWVSHVTIRQLRVLSNVLQETIELMEKCREKDLLV